MKHDFAIERKDLFPMSKESHLTVTTALWRHYCCLCYTPFEDDIFENQELKIRSSPGGLVVKI